MPSPQEIEEKFWTALKSDMTMMLGLDGVEDGHARPMTAQLDGDRGPIWFFTAKDNAIAQKLASGQGPRAIATFVDKGHDIFATVHGSLAIDNNRSTMTGFGTATSRLGSKAARKTRSSCCYGSIPNAQKSGSMRRAWSPASR